MFDGAIDTQSASAIGDNANGAWLPAFSGIGGNNNSTTGLTSVGPSFGALLGASGSVAVRPGGGPDLPPSISTSPVVVGLRAGLRSTEDVESTRPDSKVPESGEAIVIGSRPSAQADLGRSGSSSGATNDVFRQRFPLATSGDGAVCNQDAVEPDARTRDAKARDCPPAKK